MRGHLPSLRGLHSRQEQHPALVSPSTEYFSELQYCIVQVGRGWPLLRQLHSRQEQHPPLVSPITVLYSTECFSALLYCIVQVGMW